jgi:hypothetical protein
MQSAEERVRCCTEEHGWTAVTVRQWQEEEFEERFRACRAYGWERLSKQEEDDAYAAAERLVGRDWNSLHALPHIAWNCAAAADLPSDGDFEILETDLTMGILAAFRESLPRGRTFQVIDPNHSCFRFNPHAGIRSAYRDQWAKPIYPRGDNYCYFEREMKMGLLCRVQTKEIVVFGPPLIEAVLAKPPILFTGVPSRRARIA